MSVVQDLAKVSHGVLNHSYFYNLGFDHYFGSPGNIEKLPPSLLEQFIQNKRMEIKEDADFLTHVEQILILKRAKKGSPSSSPGGDGNEKILVRDRETREVLLIKPDAFDPKYYEEMVSQP